MTDYEPGTVATATVRGVPNVRVFRYNVPGTPVWFWMSPDGHCSSLDRDVTNIRPLVVLDLDESTSHLSRTGGLDFAIAGVVSSLRGSPQISHKKIADQIEAQTKPPRIPEPGLWGVVETHTGTHVNVGCGWQSVSDGVIHPWGRLVDPVLIREGL